MTLSSKTDGRTLCKPVTDIHQARYKPRMSFGTVVSLHTYHIMEQYRDKLDARTQLCIYLGIPDHKKEYRLMDINTDAIVYSRDVVFKEDEFPPLVD
ncbi:Transposon Polyprotein integrase [Phytophthora palmivora]|uniref:Transposon Polyprotein integrase n=1 Tax=Phytophthora palmivora TaxID=4796 RepID=A0A2P4WWW9_9STRA|nr:Transposon Polyprotein integrase [Phytophthora palmivora]